MISSKVEEKETFVSPSDLDERLRADKDGSLKKQLTEKLEAYYLKVNSALNKGDLVPNEFEAAKKIGEAILQAQLIIKERSNKAN